MQMSAQYFATPMSAPFGVRASATQISADATPIYQQVLTWVLLLPMLYLVVYGQFSLTNLSNSALMTENGDLLQTSQSIRPQVVLYVVFMVAFILVGHREIWRVAVNNRLLLLGPLLAALSVTWSESPLLTLRVAIELTMTTLFAFYLSERFSTEHLMKLLMFVGTVAAISSILLALFAPEYGIYHRDGSGAWQGIFSHKNALGVGMAFLLTPVFFSAQRLVLKLGYGALLLFLIGMSQSREAWFVTIGILAFTAWLSIFRRLRGKESLLLTAITIAAAIAMVVLGVLYLDPLMRFIGKDPTLTGRTEIYRAVLASIVKHPILGYGYGAFWHGLNHESLIIALRIHWMTVGYAENGFLELWLWLGTIGLCLVLLYFGKAIGQSIQLLHSRYYTPRVGWFSVIIFLELMTNIEAGVVLAPSHINWTMTLIAFVGLGNEMRQKGQLTTTRADLQT
jgi:O-antigen ligase